MQFPQTLFQKLQRNKSKGQTEVATQAGVRPQAYGLTMKNSGKGWGARERKAGGVCDRIKTIT